MPFKLLIPNICLEFEHTPGDGEGQGSLVSCSPWGHKELDVAEQLNRNAKAKEIKAIINMT